MPRRRQSHGDRPSRPVARAADPDGGHRAFDPQLLAVKDERDSWEYCWTAKGPACRYLFATEPDLDVLTYVDGDLHFSSSPAPMFAELGDRSILVTPHRTPGDDDNSTGLYNAGWITFRNDAVGNAALDWWRERCLEWCYDRGEPGRYGDQKYLDQLPARFGGVQECESPAVGLALWNESAHTVELAADGPPLVDGEPLVYFHHSGLRVSALSKPAWLGARLAGRRTVPSPIPLAYGGPSEPASAAVEEIWRRYAADVSSALAEIEAAGMPREHFVKTTSLSAALRRRLGGG